MILETDVRERCHTAGLEVGGGGHEPRNGGDPRKLEKARKPISPRALRRNAALLTPGY